MKPILPYFITFIFTVFFTACSPEVSNSNAPEDNNKFIYNGVTYPLKSAIVTIENGGTTEPNTTSIRLFNKASSEITNNMDLDDLTFVNFEIASTDLQISTYDEINRYDMSINGSISNSIFQPGTILLSDDDSESEVYAANASVTITNYTAYNILFTFSFTRNDGEIITGSYDGNYLLSNP